MNSTEWPARTLAEPKHWASMLLPTPTGRRRRRVQRVLEADVVIGVDGDVAPERHVVGDAVVRQQQRAFLVFEDHQWRLVRGAVVALAGDLEAPWSGLAAGVV